MRMFAGMRTQPTSTLRQAQPRRRQECLKRPAVISSFDLHMAFQICHLPMIYDGIRHISWLSAHICHSHIVLWHDLSHRSLLVHLKQFTDVIKSWDELSKKGKPLKKEKERHVFIKLFCDTH